MCWFSAQDFLISASLTSPTPSTSRISSGLAGDDIDRPFAERLDDALGQHGPDALDQAGGQEFLDALTDDGRTGVKVSTRNCRPNRGFSS